MEMPSRDLQLLGLDDTRRAAERHGGGGAGGGDVLVVVVVATVKSSLWWWECECGGCLWSYRGEICFPSLVAWREKVKAA
jgi:hypothetical protein